MESSDEEFQKTLKDALLEDINQEIIEINGLINVLNVNLDELLELVESDGSLIQSVQTTSETYQELLSEFKRLISVADIGSGDK